MNIFLSILIALALIQNPQQPKPITFDKMIHDFGTIDVDDKELECSFTMTNNSSETQHIFAVVSTCGCTAVDWTKEGIEPGGKATVKIVYTNDGATYPFDKAITVYTSAQKKPIILHVKGAVKKK